MSQVVNPEKEAFAIIEDVMARTGKGLQDVVFMVAALYLDHTQMDRLTTRINIPGRGSYSIVVKRNKGRRVRQ